MRWLCDKSLASSQACPLDGCPMFADFRVHGLNKTFFQCFHCLSTPTYRKEKGGASPGFPVEFGGVGELHAAFLTESRTRGHVRCSVQEIRVAHLVQPMYAKVREHGAPVQGARLGGKPGRRWTK
jgi:hypothetical protein